MVRVGEDGGDDPLAVGIVQGIVDRGGRYPEPGGLVAVDVDEDREPLGRQIAGDIGELRKLVQLVDELRRPFGTLCRIGVL